MGGDAGWTRGGGIIWITHEMVDLFHGRTFLFNERPEAGWQRRKKSCGDGASAIFSDGPFSVRDRFPCVDRFPCGPFSVRGDGSALLGVRC